MAQSPESIEITNPWTGAVEERFEVDSPSAIEARIGAAVEAARAWAEVGLEARVRLVERFVEVALAQREAIAARVTRWMGKPISESRGEVGTLVARARMMAALAPEGLADRGVAIGDGIRRAIVRDPLGVVVDVAAWNYPLIIAGNVVVPAVLAGNAVIIKHASQTAGVGPWFADAMREAGAPEGLVSAVIVPGSKAAPLLEDPRVAGVFFTGGVEGGRQVYRTVAGRADGFVDVGLELGGKDPAYVRADMPIEVAAPNLVEGAFYNAGQSCCAVERIYVDDAIYDAFVEAYVEAARGWEVGDPTLAGTRMGPVAQRSTLATLQAQIGDAVARGGRVLLGGQALEGPGFRWPATVVAEATDEMTLMHEESFGPVIGIARVSGDEEAVRRMNASRFGLTASIWTADVERGAALARRTSAGTCFVNRCDYVDPALPWTGFRDSGKGVTLSALAWDHLTRARGIHARPLELMR